jgi:nucleoside-diphosphate-sugar epimerase
MISIFGGTGFIGTEFRKHCSDITFCVPRNSILPTGKEILYLISTTDNYGVWDDMHRDVQTNLVHLLQVLQHVRPGDTFNFVSSWFVYGSGAMPARETDPCDPKGFYSITKYAAEQLIRSFCETRGVNYRIFRLANVYGIGDKGCSQKKNAMQWLVGKVARGEDVQLYHGGNTIRDYLHVEDAARAIDCCIREAPLNSITNIGSGKHYKLSRIIEYAKQISGSRSHVIAIEPTTFHRQVQTKDFAMDVSKLKSYGFRRKVTMEQGIRGLCYSLK